MKNEQLAGKVALVTGGSRGIGAAIAKRLATDGASVAITYTKGEDAAAALVRAIEKRGGKAIAIRADAADADAVKRAAELTFTTFGRLDVLVNNAGTCIPEEVEKTSLENFDRVFAGKAEAPSTAGQACAFCQLGSSANRQNQQELPRQSGLVGPSYSSMTVKDIQAGLIGRWTSIAPEVRPSRNPDGTIRPFYLSRDFAYADGDRFELTILNHADPTGKATLAKIFIVGHVFWRGEHPIASGAEKVDFIADTAYEVTPLHEGFANVLNQVASQGYDKWELGRSQSIFGKAFAPFRLEQGKNFMEFDLIYIVQEFLFWGARHVDGRGFDSEENRPSSLQIPLQRQP
jgi:NAD(P)-dependent dehydrogenase (short-subunit alcohol dehydrogenase family)